MKRHLKKYSSLPYNPALLERAKQLRKAGNLSEVLLWQQIKKGQINGIDFDRQKVIGNYIVDFFAAEQGIVVEIDGESHNDKPDYDEKRDEFLRRLGLKVLHLLDMDVKQKLNEVILFLLEETKTLN